MLVETEEHKTHPAPGARFQQLLSNRAWLPDLVLVLLLFASGVWAGSQDVTSWLGQGQYYQHEFAPAVMLACGRGYENPDLTALPTLQNFLLLKSDNFDCRDLPKTFSTDRLDYFHRLHIYLFGAVAAICSLAGVSCAALTPLFAILYGTSTAMAYGLLRLGVGRIVATLGTIWFTFSAVQLVGLISLRDYSKTTFILVGIFLIGYIVTRVVPVRRLMSLAAACGAITGIGIGFRIDALVTVPAFALAVLFFLPRTAGTKFFSSAFLAMKALVLGAFGLAFLVTGWPIMTDSGGSSSWDNSLLGFMQPFDNNLGVTSSIYSWGELYSDQQVNMLDEVAATYYTGASRYIQPSEPLYDRVGAQTFANIVINFPADMLTRAYAAILSVSGMPFWNTSLENVYMGVPGTWSLAQRSLAFGAFMSHYRGYYQVMINLFHGMGIFIMGATLLIVSRRSLRLALFLAFVLLYFGGYVMLQFQLRQYFYLEILSIWASCFVLQKIVLVVGAAIARIRSAVKRKGQDPTTHTADQSPSPGALSFVKAWWNPSTRRMIGFALGMAVLLVAPLLLLRAYQQDHLQQLFLQYENAGRDPLQVTYSPALANAIKPAQPDTTLIRPQGLTTTELQPNVRAEYLMIEVVPQHGYMPITIRYQPYPELSIPDQQRWDLSTRVVLMPTQRDGQGAPTDLTQVYVPLYSAPYVAFEGIEVPNEDLHAVKAVYRLRTGVKLPLLWFTLDPGWQQADLFQRIISVDEANTYPSPSSDIPANLAGPFERKLAANDMEGEVANVHPLVNDSNICPWCRYNLETFISQALAPRGSQSATTRPHGFVMFDGSGLRVDRNVTAASGNLVHFKAQHEASGSYLLADGFVYWGCFDIILSKPGVFSPVRISTHGDFTVVLRVPAEGDYNVLLASCYGDNDYVLREIGWKPGLGP